MTRQPSPPRTADVALLDVIGEALGYPVVDDPAWLGRLAAYRTAIGWEAEAATPAGLDVERLAEAMGSMKWGWLSWVDGDVAEPMRGRRATALRNAAASLAAEYARLREGASE